MLFVLHCFFLQFYSILYYYYYQTNCHLSLQSSVTFWTICSFFVLCINTIAIILFLLFAFLFIVSGTLVKR